MAVVQTNADARPGGRFNSMGMAMQAYLVEGMPERSPADEAAHQVQFLRDRVFPAR